MALIKQEAVLLGMSCNHCVKSVEKELDKLSLITKEVDINYLNVEYNDDQVTQTEIENAVREAGYEMKITEVRISAHNIFAKT